MAPDYLNKRPAKANTVVPGHWIIKLPEPIGIPQTNDVSGPSRGGTSTPRIHVRRYKATNGTPAGTKVEDVLGKIRGDVLETAWRVVNSSNPVDGKDEIGRILQGGCAVIIAEGDQRTLWVFTDENKRIIRDKEGVEEVLPVLEPADPARLVKCPKHGHDLNCLNKIKPDGPSPCPLHFDCQEAQRMWMKLQDAIAEKIAWRSGRRIVMSGNPVALTSYSENQPALYPLSSTRLLLTLKRVEPPVCPQSQANSAPLAQYAPLLLRPLALPALDLGDFNPSPAQEESLTSRFCSFLGPRFGDGASHRQIDHQLGAVGGSSWTICWIPFLSPEEITVDIAKTQAIELVKTWHSKQGVVAIWPSHFIHHLVPSSHARTRCGRTGSMIAPINDLPASNDLMAIASGLFEAMSAVKEPQLAETPPEEDMDLPLDDNDLETIGSPTLSAAQTDQYAEPSNKANSDIDDLFSSHSSPAPTPGPVLFSRDPTPMAVLPERAEMPRNAVAQMDVDVEMGSPAENEISSGQPAIPASERGEDREEKNLVTEDDFDFFDSPGGPDDGANTEEPQQGENESMGEEALDRSVATVMEAGISTTKADAAELPSILERRRSSIGVARPSNGDHHVSPLQGDLIHSPGSPTHPTQVESRPQADRVVTFAEPYNDIVSPPPGFMVPFDFAPLDMINSMPSSFAYSMPSPAPTPEALRPELIDRLGAKSADKKVGNDYTSAWDVQSEDSDMDTDDGGYTGPPTPLSLLGGDDELVVNNPLNQGTAAADTIEISWEGIPCVGSELLSLCFDLTAMEQIKRSANDSWLKQLGGALTQVRPPSPADVQPIDSDLPDKINVGCLITDLISNRHFREYICSWDNKSDIYHRSTPVLDIGTPYEGQPISVLACVDDHVEGEEKTKAVHSMQMCRVSAGFAGKVMQLSIAGLRYWNQLGLEPSGGKKDLSAFVICTIDEAAVLTAKRFLSDISSAYQSNKLGRHTPGTAPAARDGMISLPVAGFADSLAALCGGDHHNTVIYVLLPPKQLDIGLVERLYSITSQSPTCFAQILPGTGVQQRHLHNIAFEVYDRVPKPLRPISIRGTPVEIPAGLQYAQYSSFTLVAQTHKPELVLAWPLRSYDVMNKWRIIHIGYSFDESLDWLVTFGVDSEGEAWEIKHWKITSKPIAYSIGEIWRWSKEFASKLAVEWRLSICRLGMMSVEEIEAWGHIMRGSRDPASLLMMTSPMSSGGGYIPSRNRASNLAVLSSMMDPSSRIIDESLIGHSTTMGKRFPIRLPNTDNAADKAGECRVIFPQSSFLLNMASAATTDYSTSMYQVLSHRKPPNRDEEDPDRLFAEEYYRLTCLARMRFGMEDADLPVHLQGVQVALRGINVLATALSTK